METFYTMCISTLEQEFRFNKRKLLNSDVKYNHIFYKLVKEEYGEHILKQPPMFIPRLFLEFYVKKITQFIKCVVKPVNAVTIYIIMF